jgi:glycosyltransferase involved in cell wall biosynthesis
MLCFPCQWYEGFPNVIITGMEHRKPVIAGRIGALPEIVIDGQTGLLHDPPSIDQLVSHIEKLNSDDELCRQYGEQGFKRIFSEYHVDLVYPRLVDVYQQVQASVAKA